MLLIFIKSNTLYTTQSASIEAVTEHKTISSEHSPKQECQSLHLYPATTATHNYEGGEKCTQHISLFFKIDIVFSS